jgi:hypothetical protein
MSIVMGLRASHRFFGTVGVGVRIRGRWNRCRLVHRRRILAVAPPADRGERAGITFEPFPPELTMPIRIASLSRQLHKNGQRLHLAMMSRSFSHGADPSPSEQEKALREERSALKAAQVERRAKALLPKVKPVRVAKAAAKPAKAPKAPKAAKPPKEKAAKTANKPSRADKQTKKAENLEAAKKADRKSAKT